jgi:hypothetical protein
MKVREILELLLKARRRRNVVASLAQKLTEDENTIPYCSVFSDGPRFSFPPDFSVSNYRGLLFCHVLKDNQDIKVIACWKGEGHFRACEARFRGDLGLKSSWAGTVIDVQKPTDSFWKRQSLTTKILTIAALFGALSVIRDYYFVLFGVPYVGLSYSEDKKAEEVIEGGPISVPLTALSEIRFAPTKVIFDSVWLQPKSHGAEQKLRFDNVVFANLAPGQSASLKILGVAPEHSKTQQTPDIYEIHVAAMAKAGILWPRRSVSPPRRELRVWATKLGNSPLRLSRVVGSTVCVLDGTIFPSRTYPRGVAAEIVYPGAPSEIASMYSSIKDSKFVDVGTGPTRVMKGEFNTPALSQFEEFHYQVYLYLSKPVASRQCQNWPDGFQVTVE